MSDLTTLPSKLAPIRTLQGNVTVERLNQQHTEALCKAGQDAIHTVKPWLGTSLCPVTVKGAKQCIQQLEDCRQAGIGIAYLLVFNGQCLGMGIVNQINPLHRCANLGYWLTPAACGKGLALTLCQRLIKLADDLLNLLRLELYIEPTNTASLRLAQRLQATKEGLCRKRLFGRDALLYSILPEEHR